MQMAILGNEYTHKSATAVTALCYEIRFGFYGRFRNISLIEPIVYQRWVQTGVRGVPDLLVQNLASNMGSLF